MHKCINNSIGNVYHLEQFVSDFFPYSQKQLGFDKPATIRFESDQDNAGVMLGKTAYYDPEAMEVVLYTDGRHPKDIMRSLSHELVHHAQNCRGDFTEQDNTGPGYAQEDPHMRKMEREAYTKGNLIFRDFEDLIKTEKINIEIDFSDSGEPKMSLKEWKNDEINTKLMKKWGFLKESRNEEYLDYGKDPSDLGFGNTHSGESCADVHPEDTAKAGGDSTKGHGDWQKRGGFEEWKAAQKLKEWAPGFEPAGETHDFTGRPLDHAPKGTKARHSRWYAGDSKADDNVGGHKGYAHDDPESEEYHTDPALEKRREYQRWRIANGLAEDLEEGCDGLGDDELEGNKKISVREAKEITRRIIERIKLENK